MFFKRKKRKEKVNTNEFDESVHLNQSENKDSYIVDQCEQIIDASRELEDARSEYKLVTSYLNDIQVIEELSKEEMKQIAETASNIVQLNSAHNEFLKTERQISDAQFAQLQEAEDEIPDAIKRLQANEAYLDTVKRDMNYLEGEKTELGYEKHHCIKKQKLLRKLAFLWMAIFVIAIFILLVMRFAFSMDTQLFMIIAAFLATVAGAFTLIRYQDYTATIQKADVNINHAISLENHIKIKYVNIKNAVDYVYEKYHVKNSYEFIYIWEKYNEAVKKREKQRQTNEDLEYFNGKLVRQLKNYHLYDAKIWINYANALVNKKEMVEVKHDLIVRRQKLRARIEYNIQVIGNLKKEIHSNSLELGERSKQVQKILERLEQINGI